MGPRAVFGEVVFGLTLGGDEAEKHPSWGWNGPEGSLDGACRGGPGPSTLHGLHGLRLL